MPLNHKSSEQLSNAAMLYGLSLCRTASLRPGYSHNQVPFVLCNGFGDALVTYAFREDTSLESVESAIAKVLWDIRKYDTFQPVGCNLYLLEPIHLKDRSGLAGFGIRYVITPGEDNPVVQEVRW